MHPFFDNDGFPVAMSHHGDTSDGDAAGSFAAYRRAYDLGFRYVQVDVVRIGGGRLVSGHSITGRRRDWEDDDLASLRTHHPHLATLDELIEGLPDARFNIEIKHTVAVGPLIDLLRGRTDVLGRFSVSSPFRRRILRRMRAAFGDELCTCASLVEGGLVGVPLWPGWGRHADAVQVLAPLVVSDRVIEWNRARGIQFQVWPVARESRMRALLARGVGGIITDEHATLKDCLTELGQWREPVVHP